MSFLIFSTMDGNSAREAGRKSTRGGVRVCKVEEWSSGGVEELRSGGVEEWRSGGVYPHRHIHVYRIFRKIAGV